MDRKAVEDYLEDAVGPGSGTMEELICDELDYLSHLTAAQIRIQVATVLEVMTEKCPQQLSRDAVVAVVSYCLDDREEDQIRAILEAFAVTPEELDSLIDQAATSSFSNTKWHNLHRLYNAAGKIWPSVNHPDLMRDVLGKGVEELRFSPLLSDLGLSLDEVAQAAQQMGEDFPVKSEQLQETGRVFASDYLRDVINQGKSANEFQAHLARLGIGAENPLLGEAAIEAAIQWELQVYVDSRSASLLHRLLCMDELRGGTMWSEDWVRTAIRDSLDINPLPEEVGRLTVAGQTLYRLAGIRPDGEEELREPTREELDAIEVTGSVMDQEDFTY